MSSSDTDKVFSGSIPKLYETYLVPLIFQPYAADLVNRLVSRSLTRVLEIAAGTGVVTRTLASVLPESVCIVATDLNQPMLNQAAALGTKRPVEWRQADAMQLPFRDGTFDAVVCQFGVMFFGRSATNPSITVGCGAGNPGTLKTPLLVKGVAPRESFAQIKSRGLSRGFFARSALTRSAESPSPASPSGRGWR